MARFAADGAVGGAARDEVRALQNQTESDNLVV
jgi:hypothetical protein